MHAVVATGAHLVDHQVKISHFRALLPLAATPRWWRGAVVASQVFMKHRCTGVQSIRRKSLRIVRMIAPGGKALGLFAFAVSHDGPVCAKARPPRYQSRLPTPATIPSSRSARRRLSCVPYLFAIEVLPFFCSRFMKPIRAS